MTIAPGVDRSRSATYGSRRAWRSAAVNSETDAPIWLVGVGVFVAVTMTFSAIGATASSMRNALVEHGSVAASKPVSDASTLQLLPAVSKWPLSSANVEAVSLPEVLRMRTRARGMGRPDGSTTVPVTAGSAACAKGIAASERKQTNSDVRVREWLTRAPFGVSRTE